VQSTVPRPSTLAGRPSPELAGLFARGGPPEPELDGRYRGALLGADAAPGVDAVLDALLGIWQPWLGKRFDAAAESGENVFDRSAFAAGRRLTPARYRIWWSEDETAFRALRFVTGVGRSLLDPGVRALSIDYDQPENPPRLRAVVDELVEVEPGVYLGQALWRRWGVHRLVWFTLER
jgi:hypothetical protein